MRRLDPPALEGAGGGRRADEGFFEVGGEGFGQAYQGKPFAIKLKLLCTMGILVLFLLWLPLLPLLPILFHHLESSGGA